MAYGGSTGQKEFISADILTNNVEVDESTFTVSGEGLFDRLMETATKHLQVQFDANRIRQEDYAQAYIDIYKATLQAALQAWDTTLKDKENEARLALFECQAKLACAQAENEAIKSDILTQQIQQAIAETARTEAQTAQIEAETDKARKQIEQIEAQTGQIEAQTAQYEYQTTYLLPKQVEELTAKIAHTGAQTNQIAKEIEKSTAQISQIEAQTAQYTYQTEHLLPKQVEELTAKIANTQAQTATEDKKPALVEEQTKQIIEQTKESQAKQGLTKRQAMAYNDEFRQKMFKIMMDSWSVGFSAGSDSKEITVPGVITTPAINEFYSQMRSYIMDLSADTLKWSNTNNGAGDVVTASNPVSGKQLTRGVIVNNSDTLSGFRPDFVDNGGKTPADQLPSDQEDGSKITGRVTYPRLDS